MAEIYPNDAVLHARSGSCDAEQEVYYPPIGQSPYYTSFYRMLHRLLDVARRAGDLRVYKDGALSFGVRPGRWMNGIEAVDYGGAAEQALTDEASNYVYLTAAGQLVVNTAGFPSPADTPHLPLAIIATSDGDYGGEDIADCRGRCLMAPVTALSSATTNAYAARTFGVAISHDSEGTTAANTIRVTVQAVDAAGNAVACRAALTLRLAQAEYAAADPAGNTVAIHAGTTLQMITANAEYRVQTDAAGKVALNITIAGAAARYLMADFAGLTVSSGPLNWSA